MKKKEETPGELPRTRKSYVRSFKPDGSGGYTYEGGYVTSTLDEKAYLGEIRILLGLAAGLAAAYLVPGFLGGTGMEENIFLLLPYALGLAVSLRILWLVIRMRKNGNRMRDYIYERTAGILTRWTVISLTIAVAGLLGLLYSVVSGNLSGSGAGFFLSRICQGAGAVQSLLLFLRSRRLSWR